GSDALVLVVEDDGAFAEAGEASAPGVADDLRGFGLDGMRRRAERLGGRFTMRTHGGTTVRVEIPWEQASVQRSA
ncbi:MAG: sensor histidine kinase, partial [Bacteroidota bacterium]